MSTEQQNLERAARAATREAARQRRNNNPNQPRTIPKAGDLNSMLAWAIENSDPDKLKEIREVAEKVEAGEKNGTKRVLTSDEEALIGAESASMARGAVEMARYVISHKMLLPIEAEKARAGAAGAADVTTRGGGGSGVVAITCTLCPLQSLQ